MRLRDRLLAGAGVRGALRLETNWRRRLRVRGRCPDIALDSSRREASMSNRLRPAAKRLVLVGLAVAAVTALSGCVVVPAHRAGYGYYEGSGGYVRTPPPPPRYYPHYHPHYRYRGW